MGIEEAGRTVSQCRFTMRSQGTQGGLRLFIFGTFTRILHNDLLSSSVRSGNNMVQIIPNTGYFNFADYLHDDDGLYESSSEKSIISESHYSVSVTFDSDNRNIEGEMRSSRELRRLSFPQLILPSTSRLEIHRKSQHMNPESLTSIATDRYWGYYKRPGDKTRNVERPYTRNSQCCNKASLRLSHLDSHTRNTGRSPTRMLEGIDD